MHPLAPRAIAYNLRAGLQTIRARRNSRVTGIGQPMHSEASAFVAPNPRFRAFWARWMVCGALTLALLLPAIGLVFAQASQRVFIPGFWDPKRRPEKQRSAAIGGRPKTTRAT